ncbi:hypothetical protein K3495_g16329 [Podosphaera aphanis]|nr:hypothetical protein K3495_g16329 [Podosphaera aphanis]
MDNQQTSVINSQEESQDIETHSPETENFSQSDRTTKNTATDEESNNITRSLRSNTVSGQPTRKNYVDLARFNPRQHIRQPKSGNGAYMSIEGRNSGDFYVNSPQFSEISHALIAKNGDDDLLNTIKEAREHKDSIQWEKAIQKELDILREKNTWELL